MLYKGCLPYLRIAVDICRLISRGWFVKFPLNFYKFNIICFICHYCRFATRTTSFLFWFRFCWLNLGVLVGYGKLLCVSETQAQFGKILGSQGVTASAVLFIKRPVIFTLSAQPMVILRVWKRFKNPLFFSVPVMKSSIKVYRQLK